MNNIPKPHMGTLLWAIIIIVLVVVLYHWLIKR